MPDHTTPDDLDELDRRVYELAIQPIPLAEIAVRLGVPVPQADDKLQRVFRRLGVEDRAGLRALTSQPPPAPAQEAPDTSTGPDADEDYVIGAEPAQPAPRTFSRRSVLTAGGVAAVTGVAALAGLAWNGGRQPKTSDTPASPTAGNSLPILEDGDFPLTRQPGLSETFRVEEWASGERIDWSHGIFAMSSETGNITGYQLSDGVAGGPGLARYRMLGDGRFVAAEAGGTGWLIDRQSTAQALRWELGQYGLLAAFGFLQSGPKSFLFESVAPEGRTFHFVQDTGPSVVERSRTTLSDTSPGFPTQVIQEPGGGKRVAVFAGPAEQPQATVFDITSGERLASYDPEARAGTTGVALALPFQRIESGFLIRWMTTAGNAGGGIPQRFFSWPIRWSGNQLAPARDEDVNAFYSPDGITAAHETVASYPAASLANGFPRAVWPSVAVLRGRDEPFDFRLRSSSLLYGDGLPPNRWLSDGSGFVAAVRGTSPSHHQYAIVRDPATPIEILPPPPEASREWYDTSWVCGPVPSPESPVLLSFGRLYLYNLKSQQWFSARLSDSGGPAHLDPWSGAPGEMVFALPHGGHGGSEPPILLAPKFEEPPFDDNPNLVVEVDPEGLNLRDAPSLSAEVLGLLQNGDRLTLVASPDGDIASTFNTNFNEDALWLRVRTESGLEGWVNSTWIAWA